MAMTFGVYDFLQDSNDMLNGVVPTDFAASYTDVEIAMFAGTIVLINEDKGRRFNLQYTFTDGVIKTAAEKLTAIQALKKTTDTLIKDNVIIDGVMLKNVTIQSRKGVGVPFVSVSASPEQIICSLSFHKID